MTNDNEQPKRKFGGRQPGAGRKSKAAEFGLAELMDEAWPHNKRLETLQHIAQLTTTARSDKIKVEAAELLLKYAYGTPKAIDVTVDFDLNADIDAMSEAQREIYKLKLQQYLAKRGITS